MKRCVRQVITINVSHNVQKDFLDSNFSEAVIDKISSFHKIAPNSTFSQKSYFLSIFGTF